MAANRLLWAHSNIMLYVVVLRSEGDNGWTRCAKIRVCHNKSRPMALLQEKKQEIINAYQVHTTDTGSSDVQVAMLTERISRLSNHLKTNKKDHSSRRGLLKMIGQRKSLLSYIQRHDNDRYRQLITRLGIRG
jgi:small subunit ribosomal protein S15